MKIKAKSQLSIVRLRAGFSIKTLAEEIGVTPQGYGQIERKRNNAGVLTAHKIAKALNVDFDDIFEIEEEESA